MNTNDGLLKRYAADVQGVLGCFDRLAVTGTLSEVAHPEAMAAVLYREGIRCFDIGQFAEPLRTRIRDNALEAARAAGVELEYLSRSEDGALHGEKYFRTVTEEFAATRPAFRWRQLCALARVTASECGRPAAGVAEARDLLRV